VAICYNWAKANTATNGKGAGGINPSEGSATKKLAASTYELGARR